MYFRLHWSSLVRDMCSRRLYVTARQRSHHSVGGGCHALLRQSEVMAKRRSDFGRDTGLQTRMLLTMFLLTWTTPFAETLQVLRRLRVPAVMLTTLALMVRYLPVLAEETTRMQRARASRTFTRRRGAAWPSPAWWATSRT